MNRSIVVMGLGNLLLGDEGLGVRALTLLGARSTCSGARLVDGGTLGLSLLPVMEEATHLLLLDAVRAPEPPGTIIELADEELTRCQRLRFSAHDVSLTDLLALLSLRSDSRQRRVCLIGMVPSVMAPGTELSPQVRASLPVLADRAEEQLRRWRLPLVSAVVSPPGSADAM